MRTREMKKLTYLLLSALILLLMTGCSTTPVRTLQDVYPGMYSQKPVSILILPPVNNSTAAEAKEYFACSLAEAIGLKGYYPMPVEAMYTILRDEGLYETETMDPVILNNMKKYFGADAVLYTTIEKWDKVWFLLAGSLTIDVKYALISTETAEVLWDFATTTRVSLGSSSSNLLVAAVESAVKTAVEDYFPNARQTNILTFEKTMPLGNYHPNVGLDAANTANADKKGVFNISK